MNDPHHPHQITKNEIIFFLIDRGYNLLALAIRYGTFAFIAYCAYLVIGELAGKETLAMLFVEIVSTKLKTYWLCSGLAMWAIIWAMGERIARHQTVKRLSRRIQKLERRLDPNRSSSGIQQTGETNPEDMP